MNRKFILNADDFGMSKSHNNAVLKAFTNGFLTSASIIANAEEFEHAINEILPQCHGLSIGVHLNIIEGKALTNIPLLTDKNGMFKCRYPELILKSYNKIFLEQIEKEFRAQIETVLSKSKVSHIDSHVHTHAIPNIFKITAKLAKEYKIPYIRTQFECMYLIPSLKKHLTFKYPINIIKVMLLNTFTKINSKVIKSYYLTTNDYLIGVKYTGMMDENAIIYALKALRNKDCVVETLIHPIFSENSVKDNHSVEFKLAVNRKLKEQLYKMGFELINQGKVISKDY